LAVEIERAGDGPAWLIDTDSQHASHWHERRAEESPSASMRRSRIREGLKRAADEGAAYCLIDTAPTISEQSRAMVALADLVIIPVRPRQDLWPVGERWTRRRNSASRPVRHHAVEGEFQHHRASCRRAPGTAAWPPVHRQPRRYAVAMTGQHRPN
jgi:hypothetical protein